MYKEMKFKAVFLGYSRILVKEEYLVIILRHFFLFLHKNICQGTPNEYPQKTFFMVNCRKLSQNNHISIFLSFKPAHN